MILKSKIHSNFFDTSCVRNAYTFFESISNDRLELAICEVVVTVPSSFTLVSITSVTLIAWSTQPIFHPKTFSIAISSNEKSLYSSSYKIMFLTATLTPSSVSFTLPSIRYSRLSVSPVLILKFFSVFNASSHSHD